MYTGMAGIIKAALMLERSFVLPNHDFKVPNPKIPWKEWNLKVPITQRQWPRGKKYISVNNFGFGGTNGHVVLESAPFHEKLEQDAPDKEKLRKLFVLTAHDRTTLSAVMKNIVIYLEQRPEIFQAALMRHVAYTLGQRRSHLPWRAAISAKHSFEIVENLSVENCIVGKELEGLRIGFIFTGQGSQWWAMGRELYGQYPVYKNAIDHADRCLTALGADWSLLKELDRDEKSTKVNEAHISQPSCTAIQLALVDLLTSWGIVPTAVAGHSSGEIGAAYAAGLITFESAVAIAYHRGRLIPILKQRHPNLKGRMMAVGGSKEEFQPIIDGLQEKEVRIACYNSPESLTISGDEPALAELEKICEKKGAFNRRLVIDTAYHSHHMNLVAKEYRASLLKLKAPTPSNIKFHSSLHGHLISGTELKSDYWVDNLTCPVRFDEALQSMMAPDGEHKTGVNMLVELGPHSGMQGPIKQTLKAMGGAAAKVPYASALIRKKDAAQTALDLAGTLFTKGAVLDFESINQPKPGSKPMMMTDMPRYPWNYSNQYWQESRMTQKHRWRKEARSDVLGVEAIYSNDLEPTWRNIVRLDDLPWLRHHQIQSLTIFPMSAFIVMALEAAAQRAASKELTVDKFELKDVSIVKALVIPDEDTEMTITLRPHQEGTLVSSEEWDEFRICSYSQSKGWTEHCVGLVATQAHEANDVDSARQAQAAEAALRESVAAMNNAGATQVKPDEMYDALNSIGVAFGTTFQGVENCRATDGFSEADITMKDVAKEMPNSCLMSPLIHPTFLESLIEMYWPILGAGRSPIDTVYLPSSVDRISISRRALDLTKAAGSKLRAYCKGDLPKTAAKAAKVSMFATADEQSAEALITLENLTIAPIIDGETDLGSGTARELCYKLEWEPILEPLHGAANGTVNGTVNGTTNGHQEAAASEPELPDVEIAIVHEDASSLVATALAAKLEQATGSLPQVGTLQDVDPAGKICIFLSELDKPFLSSLTADQFNSLHKVLTTVEGCLWVVRGAYDKSTNPDANMVLGLSRTIRSETAMKFATLDLDDAKRLSEGEMVKAIFKVYTAAFGSGPSVTGELEFMERAGSFLTPRIVNDDETNDYVYRQTNPSVMQSTPFGAQGRKLKMTLTTPGALDTLHFVDDQAAEAPLGDDQVEIEVKAVGMNTRDIMAAKGQVPDEFGFEASGIVTAVGSAVGNFAVGDRVAALTQGAYATRARALAALALKMPEDMSFEAAAAVPLAYSVAQHSLIDLARLSEGETVLIHAASGAVGQAAITLSKMVGAEIFATVGSAEKKDLLIKEFGIPEDHIFYSRSTSFGNSIRQATGGKGVDVVLNSLTGDALRESWDCLNKFGRFVDIGKRDTSHKSRVEMAHTENNASFISVDLFALAAERPKVMKRIVSDVAKLLADGQVKAATPITTFSIADAEDALKAMQSARTPGKLVVVPKAEDLVKATQSLKQDDLLRPDATYILIGGTGGLGRSMARWMVSKGARNVVLVSRSGSAAGAVKELIDELAPTGANIVVRKCNVADKASVDDLIANGLQGLPEVRGVVHGAMVLHDVLFEKMTYEDYATVIEGKVQGGWHFHNALSGAPLDFFVAISSAAGAVGNRGQAAYAAANCFLNALVQHRLSQGLPASSLDLTMVSDSGYLATNPEKLAEVARNLGSDSICESEVLALLGAAITGRLSGCNNHTITGMRITPSMQPFWTQDAKFKHLRLAMEEAAAADASLNAKVISHNAAVKAAKNLEEAEAAVCKGLIEKISSVLMMEPEELDITRSLSHYPLDSLVAIEIRNFITREFEVNMQVLELLSSGSVQTLTKTICTKSKLVPYA